MEMPARRQSCLLGQTGQVETPGQARQSGLAKLVSREHEGHRIRDSE